ncbi:MAG: NAD(P)H-dependent flavin oxidoreductase [Chloroflexota bacterium]
MGNRVCGILGVEYPIIMGGMVWVGSARLAAAVSNAGALGMVASGHLAPEELRGEIRLTREMTDRPFGVNIPLRNPWAADWTDLGRASWFRVVIEEKVPVVFTSAGDPRLLTARFKEAGLKVVHVVSNVRQARKAEEAAVDAVVAEGFEAGGHNGPDELSTMVLVPQVVDAVGIPVIAAGGIADARGFVAALALGAEGIQMGTRFAATTESPVHDRFKRALLSAKDTDTVIIGRRLGPMRVIRNRLAREVLDLEAEGVAEDVLLALLGRGRTRMASVDGDLDDGIVMSGQIAGLIRGLAAVSEVVGFITEGSEGVHRRIVEQLAAIGATVSPGEKGMVERCCSDG